MKFRSICLCALAALFLGCASNQWRADDVPYPQTTPFDSNQFARTTYLDGFAQGYRSAMGGSPVNVDMLTGPYAGARRAGFYAGEAHARAAKKGGRPVRQPAP